MVFFSREFLTKWFADLMRRWRWASGLETFLRFGGFSGGSSDLTHASQLCDAGASTHLLGHWVREKEVLTLEEAVRKLTSEPADLFGMTDRGRLAPGTSGDLAIFEPGSVACGELQRVNDFPAGADRLIAPAHGMRAVVVAGEVLREENRDRIDPEGPLPGRVVRS